LKNADFIYNGSLLQGDQLLKEYRLRKKRYIEQKVPKDLIIPNGWKLKQEFTHFKKIIREKNISELLKDKVWTLLYDMGMNIISSFGFTLNIKVRNGKLKQRQIDILAADNEVAFVIECKSKENLGRKSLKKDIESFSHDIQFIRNSIKKLFNNRNIKVVPIIATENIIWDDNDRNEAKENNIIIWDEYDILALQELSSIAGQGAKYQIYNRIFFGKKVKNFEIQVPAIKAKMGGHTYYSFVMSPEHLLKIAYVHQRSGTCSFLELSDSYQRMIKASRIRQIQQYIENGGFFPGSIIINFNKPLHKEDLLGDKKSLKNTKIDCKPVIITLPPYYGCAWIIDGQHRLYGYADSQLKKTETIPVVAFIQEPVSVQTKIFVDINKNQKAIESNLLWDLYEDLYSESHNINERTLWAISKIAKKLNSEKNSPFYNSIYIPKEMNNGNITLTTVCTSIKQTGLISHEEGVLFKHNYETTIDYAFERIATFFDIFRNKLPEQWNAGDNHYIKTNSAFVVLLGILKDLLECNLTPEEINDLTKFRNTLEKKFLSPLLIHLKEADAERIKKYRAAGGAGQSSRQIRLELTKIIRDKVIGFRSPWLEAQEEAMREEILARGLKDYLDKEENKQLEFKGSLVLDINKWIFNGQIEKNNKIALEGVLRSIVGFLNTKGGTVVIGILEKNRYEQNIQEILEEDEYNIYKDKILIGIQNEYNKDGWDGFLRKLTQLIKVHIEPEILDNDLLTISKEEYNSMDFCIIDVKPAESKKFLDNRHFYIRRENITEELKGKEIDKFWRDRNRTIDT